MALAVPRPNRLGKCLRCMQAVMKVSGDASLSYVGRYEGRLKSSLCSWLTAENQVSKATLVDAIPAVDTFAESIPVVV